MKRHPWSGRRAAGTKHHSLLILYGAVCMNALAVLLLRRQDCFYLLIHVPDVFTLLVEVDFWALAAGISGSGLLHL